MTETIITFALFAGMIGAGAYALFQHERERRQRRRAQQ